MRFTKMQGIGNDYVYVNCFEETVENPGQVAKFVSNRHFGIGSDGLILICPSEKADCRMRMFNADGSEGKMCGNGIRCVGKYAYDHKIVDKPVITVETLSDVRTLELTVKDGKVEFVKVDMGEPEITSAVPEPITVDGKQYEFVGISVGNPHAAYITDDVEGLDLEKIGPYFETHERFPERTNTEFIKIIDREHIQMRVWERGSGETWACGTGATASAAAMILLGHTDRRVEVALKGGNLLIEWDEKTNHLFMTGSAAEVFHGEIDL